MPGKRAILARRLGAGAGAVVIMALVWWSSSGPPVVDVGNDLWQAALHKLAHVLTWAVLAALLAVTLSRHAIRLQAALAALAAAVLWGAVDEVHQSFSGRGAAATDVLFDAAGAIIGLALLIRLWPARRLGRAARARSARSESPAEPLPPPA